jgi:hypothetical protein
MLYLILRQTPTICTRFKCQFDYVELGICSSIPITICPSTIANDIQENHNIVDLLISMCYAAAHSGRRDLIFEPWPEFCKKKGSNTCDFDQVTRILEKVPSIKAMKKHGSTEPQLKQYLKEDVYMLIKWILTVNRKKCLLLISDRY